MGRLALRRRFEIPSRYRHLERVRIRYARWDLATCDLIDAHSGAILCALYPLDKAANAAGLRRRLDPVTHENVDTQASAPGIAPLLRKCLFKFASSAEFMGQERPFLAHKKEP